MDGSPETPAAGISMIMPAGIVVLLDSVNGFNTLRWNEALL